MAKNATLEWGTLDRCGAALRSGWLPAHERVFGNEFSQSRLREHAEHVENFEYGMIEGRREVLTKK